MVDLWNRPPKQQSGNPFRYTKSTVLTTKALYTPFTKAYTTHGPLFPFIGNNLGIWVLSTFSKTPGFLSSNLSYHKATQGFYTPNCTISHFETRHSTYSTIKSLPRADQLEHPPGQYLQRVNTPQYCYIYIISRIIKIQAHLKLFYLKTRKGWAPSLTELDNS